jgi:hypothetical protein
MSNVQLRYRTFDDVINEVSGDLHVYNLEGMIEPAQLIKVALKINKELGLKINQTKETVIEIDHHKGKLPTNFYVLNKALVCGKHTITHKVMAGRQTENIIIPGDGITTVVSECPDGNCGNFKVIETTRYETRSYNEFYKLKVKFSTSISARCPNINMHCDSNAEIRDGFIHTNFECGKVFMNYEAMMEDEDGNLLVLDHEIINEYYEYAFKLRILENLYLNGEDTVNKMNFIEERRLKLARNNALSIAYTPDFSELQKTFEMNRIAMDRKYYQMFV